VKNAFAGKGRTNSAWPIAQRVLYARNPRINDTAVNRMCSSIREFGFKIPVLGRRDGEVVDGHLRLKAAKELAGRDGGGYPAAGSCSTL
jgi:ParB-like nuclease domain